MSNVHAIDALHGMDLNLLVAFDTLMRETSVTRAAARAGVTQSAMSHTLRRLRAHFDDPLLVRGASGLVPTARAEQLIVPLRAALVGLARAVGDAPAFDAARSQRSFRLCSPDLFDVLVLPSLLAHVSAEAPAVTLSVVPWPRALGAALETGEIDLAIVPVQLGPTRTPLGVSTEGDLATRTLLRDGFRVFLRPGHPALSAKRWTARRYAALDHVLVSPRGEGAGVVEPFLAERGLTRRIALRVPHFSTALAIVTETDLLLTAPAALARSSPFAPLVASRPVPVAVPDHAVTMVWHPRYGDDPAHRWLRERVVAASALSA
ncbi:MAG: LysR family transcriptional regulator [Sandaracinaceae bacterium]